MGNCFSSQQTPTPTPTPTPVSNPVIATPIEPPVIVETKAEPWDYHKRLSSLKPKILKGHHKKRVTSIAYSSDGSFLVSGSWDYYVVIWNASTGEMIKKLKGHNNFVESVVVSPNNKYIASGSSLSRNIGQICIWNIESGECLKTIKAHTEAVFALAFSPDNKFLVSGAERGRKKDLDLFGPHQKIQWEPVCVWNVESGEFVKTLKLSNTDPTYEFADTATNVQALTFSPDNKFIVAGRDAEFYGYGGTIHIWNAESGELIKVFSGKSVPFFTDEIQHSSSDSKGHTKVVNSVAVSPDSKLILSGSSDKTIRLWNIESGECVKIFSDPAKLTADGFELYGSKKVYSVAFSPDGKRIVSGMTDGTVRVWNVESGKNSEIIFKGRGSVPESVAWSPDGKNIAAGCDNCVLHIWDVENNIYMTGYNLDN